MEGDPVEPGVALEGDGAGPDNQRDCRGRALWCEAQATFKSITPYCQGCAATAPVRCREGPGTGTAGAQRRGTGAVDMDTVYFWLGGVGGVGGMCSMWSFWPDIARAGASLLWYPCGGTGDVQKFPSNEE